MKFCTKCGNPLKPEAKFCGKCGSVIGSKSVEPPPVVNNLLCPNCSAVNSVGVKFCTTCGASFTKVQPPQPIAKTTNAKVVPPKHSPLASKPKKRRKPRYILVFSIILLLAMGAVGWWYVKGFSRTAVDEDIILPEYTSHALVSGSTTSETTEADGMPGEILRMNLSDSSGISVFGVTDKVHAKLTKESNTLRIAKTGVETCGYSLELNIAGTDSVAYAKPVITFNRSQVGDINPATLNIARVSDKLDSTGNVLKDQLDFLPVTKDAAGNYSALDYLLPVTAFKANSPATSQSFLKGLSSVFVQEARAQESKYFSEMPWVANVKYSIVTFQGNVNWARNPILVQMTPDTRKPYLRRPATKKEYTERKNPVVNIIVLVHGHNEEEKAGFDEPVTGVMQKLDETYKYLGWSNYDNTQTNGIWQYSYKRDVWNEMYRYYSEAQKKAASTDPNKPDSCTLFYEFIYPSYRPIFTPVPNNSICAHQTLGEALGKALNKEFLENNPQVAEMVKKNLPFNIFFVGHSMGGLVARAGLRSLNNKLQSNVKRLITWGSPHQGSPVTTLRYITAAGFDVSIDGLPFYPYGEGPQALMELLAMDTPGTRDLRWSNGSKGFEKFFNYDTYFKGNSKTEKLNPHEYDLRTGTMFYNQNLTTFNESEKFADKFTFLTGSTSKIAQVKKCNFLFTKAYYLLVKASDCAKGSYIINLLAGDDSYKANDGASPVYGQGGFGLWPKPRTVDMGDMDHEEFYGAKGWETAERTFLEINKSATCNCPYVDAFTYSDNKLSAKLIIPHNPKAGAAIKEAEVILFDRKGKSILKDSDSFKIDKNSGLISGTFTSPNDLTGTDPELILTVNLIDGSQVVYKTPFNGSGATTGYNRIKITIGLYGVWESESNYEGKGFAKEPSNNEVRTVGGLISNEDQFTPDWGKLPGLTWQGNAFSFHHKYQVKLYDTEERWDEISIKGQINMGTPQSVSGEAVFTSTVTNNDGGYSNHFAVSFENVPFLSINEYYQAFGLKGTDLKKYITNFENGTSSTSYKNYVSRIDWGTGGDLVVSFFNKP